ncbi:MAG: hypothetical protein V2A79_13545 [Planctomycetota bacterium]
MTPPQDAWDVPGTRPPLAAGAAPEPSTLPADPSRFWSAAVNLDQVELPARRESASTLERLPPSPFPRSGFPLVGFLATVYDHVAAHARARHEPPHTS